MKKRIDDHSAFVKGLLLPCEWLDDGTITGLCLHTQDEEVFFIEMSSIGLQMMRYLKCEIIAIGEIEYDSEGRSLITITSFSALP